MLKNKINIINMLQFYMLVLLFEFLHFDSTINVTILLESFICFAILLYFLSSNFQEVFILGLNNITVKYNYIYLFVKNVFNFKLYSYEIIFNKFIVFYYILMNYISFNFVLRIILLYIYYRFFLNQIQKLSLQFLDNFIFLDI